jgi:hypothetical protein
MRLPVVLLACSAAGILGGGALIGLWALGVCLIFVSLCAGAWALRYDDGSEAQPPQARQVPLTLQQVFDRARAS